MLSDIQKDVIKVRYVNKRCWFSDTIIMLKSFFKKI